MKFEKWFKQRVARVNELYGNLKNVYDAEKLHKYRINLRKLYSCSEVYAKEVDERRSKKISKIIKHILKPTAALRDLDLFLNEIDLIVCSQKTKVKLHKVFNFKRDKAFKKYKDAVKSSRYKKKLKKLKLAIKDKNFFIYNIKYSDNYSVIKKREKKIYDEYNKIDINTSFKELHNLRKEFKKLRYGLDIYEHCFKKDMEKLVDSKNLKELQDIFGAIQDNYVRVELIKSAKDELSKKEYVELVSLFTLRLENSRRRLFIYRGDNT